MASSDDSSLLSSCDEGSSDLSSLGSSPEPQEYQRLFVPPTPPASQDSSDADSPCPDGMRSSITVSQGDGPPPAKRRRISERKPRTTEYLDLRGDVVLEHQQEQMDRVLKVLHKRRKIVVVAGAGISVSAGIPDFRSSTGLFTSLRAEHNLKGSGKHLFDASVYKDDSSTSTFHDMVRSMSKMTKNAKPTPFHHLLATLAHEDRLLRLYSQNVDGLETGMPPLATTVPLKKDDKGKWPKSVLLHGGLDKMVCSKCSQLSDFEADQFNGPTAPICSACVEQDRVRTDIAGKRSHGIGRLRPRMVLYNEHNPDEDAIGRVVEDDLRKRPDAIIVVGTSLKIPCVKRIVREMCATVRDRRDGVAIWINHDPEPMSIEFKDCWDVVVRGTCDEVARRAALRPWYTLDDSVELTEEEWAEAAKNDVRVVINSTFKPVKTEDKFRRASKSPDFSPIARRTIDVLDADSTDSEILGAPPTPSKSARNSPAKRSAQCAFAAMDSKPAAKRKPGRPAKASTAATASSKAKVKAPVKGMKSAKSAVQTAKITQSLKASKAFASTAASKKGKSPKKGKAESEVMRPVSPENARVNGPPSKIGTPSKLRVVHFPGLSPKKNKIVDAEAERDGRMSLDRIMS